MSAEVGPHSVYQSKTLLKLSAASDAGQFWNAAQALLAQAAPCSTRWLCIRPMGMATAIMLLKQSAPGAAKASDRQTKPDRNDAALLKELFARHPAILHFRSRSGLPLVHLSPQQSPTTSGETNRWPSMDTARFGVALAFWTRRKIQGVLLLHRAEDEGDFSGAEIRALRELHPHLETALRRILASRGDEAQKHLLASMFKPLPLPLVVCDWRLNIVWESSEGSEARAHWESGESRSRALIRRTRGALPRELAEFCRTRADAWEDADQAARVTMEKDVHELPHPQMPEMQVSVSMFRQPKFPLIAPFFLFRFKSHRLYEAPEAQINPARFATLAPLSVSEREVARLILQGQSNAGISRRLGKSVHTVKAQVQSIFKKLEVKSRAKLTALLMHGSLFVYAFSPYDLLLDAVGF